MFVSTRFRDVIVPPVAILFASFVQPAAVSAQEFTAQVEEWTVPWAESRPRDPYVAPDGRVWFVGQRSDYAAVFDPETEEFEKFDLGPGVGPHNLIVDDEGLVWFAGNRQSHIGILDPVTGRIERIAMPDEAARDPHTLVFGAAGEIWFTVQSGNFVGRVDRATRKVDLVPVPTANSRPYGIDLDSNGHPWFVEFAGGKVGTIDPATLELTEYPLPDPDGRPRRIAIDSRDDVWYVDYARGELGRMTPEGEFSAWEAPNKGGSQPYALGIDDADRLWYVETGPTPNRLVAVDARTGRTLSVTPIPSGGGAVSRGVVKKRGGTLVSTTSAGELCGVRLRRGFVLRGYRCCRRWCDPAGSGGWHRCRCWPADCRSD
jgi:virginiamycin B lyase